MANEQEFRQAKRVYDTLVGMMEEDEWEFRAVGEELKVISGFTGKNTRAGFAISVDPERQIISYLSPMEASIPENKRSEMALAISAANMKLAHGGFDYSYQNGKVWFRITNTIRGSLISDDLLKYLLYVACNTVDDYFGKLERLAAGDMVLAEYLKEIHEEDD